MRKIVCLLFVLYGATLSAQTESGTLFFGGGLGFSSSGGSTQSGTVTVDKPKTSTFYIMPQVGYFIMDNMAVGVNVGYSTTSMKFSDTVSAKMNSMSYGVFGRYYMPVTESLFVLGHLGIGASSGSSESKSGGVTTEGPKVTGMDVGIKPGVAWFPTKNLGLEFYFGGLGLSTTKEVDKSGPVEVTEKTSSFDFDITNGVGFSFMYYMGR